VCKTVEKNGKRRFRVFKMEEEEVFWGLKEGN
jgi:hypothetical protein